MQLFYYFERKKEKTNEQQTKKQKQNHLRNSVFFTTWMLFNVRDKLHKAQSLKFFFFYSETFSLVLMQKTCLYFCYAVTMRSFSNRESRDQSSSVLHTQFLLIIIYLLILSPCHSTGNGRTYQLFLL